MRQSYGDKPTMPVINGEASYEMLFDKIPADWPRAMFWICMLNGAAGHTYGANGIWQCNRRGQPHGASPHGGSYGQLAWDEAMKLPGARQVALGRRFLESLPWTMLVPKPDTAAWAYAQKQPLPKIEVAPQCAVVGTDWIVCYLLDPRPVRVANAAPGATYAAVHLEPVSGDRQSLGEFRADDAGAITVTVPAQAKGDWVLLLTRQR
jgi:hypothetical protein